MPDDERERLTMEYGAALRDYTDELRRGWGDEFLRARKTLETARDALAAHKAAARPGAPALIIVIILVAAFLGFVALLRQ